MASEPLKTKSIIIDGKEHTVTICPPKAVKGATRHITSLRGVKKQMKGRYK